MTVITSSSRLTYTWDSAAANHTRNWREFVTVFTGMLSQSGWVNTNASGSIDPPNAVAPGYNGNSGYQVWRFNDDLHNAGYPVFIKVEYVGGLFHVQFNAIYTNVVLSVGFNHNGSGSLSPTVGIGSTPRLTIFQSASPGDPELYFTHKICCISGSDLVGIIADNLTAAACPFYVERIKDKNGNSTTQGVILGGYERYSNVYRETALFYGPNSGSQIPQIETLPRYLIATRTGANENNLTLGFLVPMLSASSGYPSRMLGYVYGSALTQNTTHTFPLFGTQSTYFVSSNTFANDTTVRQRASANETGQFRYFIRHE